MLRAITIGARGEPGRALEHALEQSRHFLLARSLERYPPPLELARILRVHAPEVAFLCADDLEAALRATETIEQTVPGLPVVAFGGGVEPRTLLELMKAGVRDFLPPPFDEEALAELADRLQQQLVKNPLSLETTDLVFSFLPAKAGVGTSTLAANLAVAFSRRPDTRTLLADFDLNSGLIAFMLKLASPYALTDAAEMSANMDESLWSQFIREMDNLHVLPAGRPSPGARIQPQQIHRLLAFARRLYRVICVDLSGNLEKYSIELMHESKSIFLVLTPEIPPLHLARERLNFLRQLDLGDRVNVLLNRYHRSSPISARQIEDVLGVPVYATFANSYQAVHRALVEGKPLEENSELGRQIAATAQRILEPRSARKQPARRRFLEHFAIMPARYSLREE